jgi:hypothetical protein
MPNKPKSPAISKPVERSAKTGWRTPWLRAVPAHTAENSTTPASDFTLPGS